MGLLDYTDEFLETVQNWDGRIGAPNAINRKKVSIRVFKNHFIETYVARSHPALPGVWYGPPILWSLYVIFFSDNLPIATGLALFGVGVLTWSFLEYALHRWVMHWDFGDDPEGKVKSFIMHGYHHEFPNDPYRLVAPPLMSWPVGAILAFISYQVAGPTLWIPLFGGISACYLAYDWTHYYTHHFTPKWWLGKVVRRAHMVHHFKLYNLNMGISSPLWDILLGSFGWSEDAIKDALADEKNVARN